MDALRRGSAHLFAKTSAASEMGGARGAIISSIASIAMDDESLNPFEIVEASH